MSRKSSRLFCTCLRSLVRPDDPVALVAALRSELFGISDAALYAFKRAKGRFSFRSPGPVEGPLSGRQGGDQGRFRSAESLLQMAVSAAAGGERRKDRSGPGAVRTGLASPGGDVRAGSLAKVFELVRPRQTEQLSVMDLVDYLQRSGEL